MCREKEGDGQGFTAAQAAAFSVSWTECSVVEIDCSTGAVAGPGGWFVEAPRLDGRIWGSAAKRCVSTRMRLTVDWVEGGRAMSWTDGAGRSGNVVEESLLLHR
jgi:hypothetical protein